MGDANFGLLVVCVCLLASRLRLGGRPMRILEKDGCCYCRERWHSDVYVYIVRVAMVLFALMHTTSMIVLALSSHDEYFLTGGTLGNFTDDASRTFGIVEGCASRSHSSFFTHDDDDTASLS